MDIVRATLLVFFVMAAGLNLASAAPLAIEGDKQVSKESSAEKIAVTIQDKPVALAQVDGAKAELAGNDISLHPALLLFVLALSAIFWLGRRRKQDDYVEE